ncbi:MAG: ATP-dependent zinc protease [Balneolaceae bacterium]|nr:ATP-dependent zinc protease [Balneolaceae bacterium]
MDSSLQHSKTKKIIGRVEKIDLPELSIFEIDAKIDTGAYTSSLHCHDITVEKIKGRLYAHFYVLDPNHPEYDEKQYKAPVHKIKRVRSSNGQIEERVIIKQKVIFFNTTHKIQLSLTDRSKMKYPILIGRRFLTDKFIVDVSKKFLSNQNN